MIKTENGINAFLNDQHLQASNESNFTLGGFRQDANGNFFIEKTLKHPDDSKPTFVRISVNKDLAMTFNDEILVTPDNLLRGMIKINSTEFRIKIDDYVNNLGSVPTRQESLITHEIAHEIGHTYANLLFPEQTFFFMFILGNNKAGHEKNNISKKYSENPSLIDINKR